jgi:hypothetical protein
MKGGYHSEDLGVYGDNIKIYLREMGFGVWTTLLGLRIGIGGGLL